jgi:hypothetical protein
MHYFFFISASRMCSLNDSKVNFFLLFINFDSLYSKILGPVLFSGIDFHLFINFYRLPKLDCPKNLKIFY